MDETTTTAPQAGTDGTSLTPQAGDTVTSTTPQAGDSQNKPSRSAEDYERMIADLRKENASHRTKLKTFEDEAKKQEEARLTKEQLLEKQLAELTAQREAEQQERFVNTVQQQAAVEAAKLGVDPAYLDKVFRFLEWDEIEPDDNGRPANVGALIKQLVEDMPALRGRTAPIQPASGGATNPSRQETSAIPAEITREFIANLTPDQYAKLPRDVQLRIGEISYTQPWKRR